MDRNLEMIKRYVEDTITTWDEPETEYQEGMLDTGKDLLTMIARIKNGLYDSIELEDEWIEW